MINLLLVIAQTTPRTAYSNRSFVMNSIIYLVGLVVVVLAVLSLIGMR